MNPPMGTPRRKGAQGPSNSERGDPRARLHRRPCAVATLISPAPGPASEWPAIEQRNRARWSHDRHLLPWPAVREGGAAVPPETALAGEQIAQVDRSMRWMHSSIVHSVPTTIHAAGKRVG